MDYYLSALRMAQGLNQTLIKTSTGVWSVTYNAENRPVRWERGNTIVTMDFDRMGRRVFYKEEVAGEVVTHHKFVYDNYLCVQKLDALNNNSQINLFVWDPTEPVATRPLFMLSNPGSYKFFYTFDGNKNVSELVHFESRNGIAAHYDYAPFGAVTRAVNTSAISARNFTAENPFRFSSEYHDDTLGLVYYNYRHYNPTDGRWCSRDCFNEQLLLDYVMCSNCTTSLIDLLGNTEFSFSFSRDLPTCPFGASGFFFESALEFNGEFKECFLCNKENQPEIHFFVKSKISLSAAIRYGLSYDDGIDQKGKFVYQKEGYNRYRNLKGQFASKPTTGFFKELLGLHLEEWDVVPASRENWKSLPLCPQDSATGAIDGFVNGKASVLGFGSEFNLVWRIFPNGSFTPRFDYSRGFVGGGTSLYIRAGVLGSVTFTTTY